MDPTDKNLLPSPPTTTTTTYSQSPALTSTTTSSQTQDPQTLAWRTLLHDTQLKLKESTASHSSKMNPYNPQGGSGQGGSGGKGNDPGVLNGLLPRIETRGSGRGSSSNDPKGKGGSSSR